MITRGFLRWAYRPNQPRCATPVEGCKRKISSRYSSIMKPQLIALGVALLTACASSYGQTVAPAGMQDYEAMAKAMEKAQAEANRPGDEKLTCDQLQAQVVGIAQDPAFLAYVQAAGVEAQQDMAQMQAAQSEIAAKSAATVIASMVPGAAMGHMMASAAENQAKAAQGAARVQARMAQGQQMMAFMPQLMRAQRLLELAVGRKCEWATGVGTAVPPIQNR